MAGLAVATLVIVAALGGLGCTSVFYLGRVIWP